MKKQNIENEEIVNAEVAWDGYYLICPKCNKRFIKEFSEYCPDCFVKFDWNWLKPYR